MGAEALQDKDNQRKSTRAKNRDFFAIKVPTSIFRVEFNYVLNPPYKDFGKVEVAEFFNLPLDDRLKIFK